MFGQLSKPVLTSFTHTKKNSRFLFCVHYASKVFSEEKLWSLAFFSVKKVSRQVRLLPFGHLRHMRYLNFTAVLRSKHEVQSIQLITFIWVDRNLWIFLFSPHSFFFFCKSGIQPSLWTSMQQVINFYPRLICNPTTANSTKKGPAGALLCTTVLPALSKIVAFA